MSDESRSRSASPAPIEQTENEVLTAQPTAQATSQVPGRRRRCSATSATTPTAPAETSPSWRQQHFVGSHRSSRPTPRKHTWSSDWRTAGRKRRQGHPEALLVFKPASGCWCPNKSQDSRRYYSLLNLSCESNLMLLYSRITDHICLCTQCTAGRMFRLQCDNKQLAFYVHTICSIVTSHSTRLKTVYM